MRELTDRQPDVHVVWRAFELRPDPIPTLDPDGPYLQRIWRRSVHPLAERLGMAMRLPPVQPRSRLAHEAAHWARAQGAFDAYHAAIFRAFFERGEDIGDAAVLRALAGDVGLDPTALSHALEAQTSRPAVLQDERDAEALGIAGVPAFVADRRAALTGVQPAQSLALLVEHVRTVPPPRREER